MDLGHLYGLKCQYDDALQLNQEALDEVHSDIAHARCAVMLRMLQAPQLSSILRAMGEIYLGQYSNQITNGG